MLRSIQYEKGARREILTWQDHCECSQWQKKRVDQGKLSIHFYLLNRNNLVDETKFMINLISTYSFSVDIGSEVDVSVEDNTDSLLRKIGKQQQDNFEHLAQEMKESIRYLTSSLSSVLNPHASVAAGQKRASTAMREETESFGGHDYLGPASRACASKVRRASHTTTRPHERDSDDSLEESNEATYDEDDDSVSIPDPDALDRDINSLIEKADKPESSKAAEANKDKPQSKAADNKSESKAADSLLQQIQAEISVGDDVGGDINPELAKIILNLWSAKLPAEKLKTRLTKFLKPKNCDSMLVPKCNSIIWSNKLDLTAKNLDMEVQKCLRIILKAIFGLVDITSMLLSDQVETSNSDLTVKAIDVIAILCNASQELNQHRRELIKPKLGELKGLASNVALDSPELFGSEEDLNKKITKLTSANKALGMGRGSKGGEYRSKGKFSKNFKAPLKHPYSGKKGQPRGRGLRKPYH